MRNRTLSWGLTPPAQSHLKECLCPAGKLKRFCSPSFVHEVNGAEGRSFFQRGGPPGKGNHFPWGGLPHFLFLLRDSPMRHVRIYLVLSFVLIPLIGCGATNNKGQLSGKVAYKGQPVPLGTIYFHSTNGGRISAPIKDGLYQTSDVPAGECTVTISTVSAHAVPLTTDTKGKALAQARRAESSRSRRNTPTRKHLG